MGNNYVLAVGIALGSQILSVALGQVSNGCVGRQKADATVKNPYNLRCRIRTCSLGDICDGFKMLLRGRSGCTLSAL